MKVASRRSRLVPVIAALAVLAPASSAVASSGLKCQNSSSYGSTCIAITGSGLSVGDVQGYFVPPNQDYLSRRTWAFELTRYSCDPRGHDYSQCPYTKHWISNPRKGNPPKNSSFCTTLGGEGVSVQNCQDYGMAYMDARFGDWPTFPHLTHNFKQGFWLCNSLIVRVKNHWRRNGGGGKGERGCAEVHG
jgi:hypothetical protein